LEDWHKEAVRLADADPELLISMRSDTLSVFRGYVS
jgi:hypothetical protein